MQFQWNDKNVLPRLRQGPARKEIAADKNASAAALPGFGPWGLPPHVRGKGLAALDHALAGGITPACAGKSSAGQPFPLQ